VTSRRQATGTNSSPCCNIRVALAGNELLVCCGAAVAVDGVHTVAIHSCLTDGIAADRRRHALPNCTPITDELLEYCYIYFEIATNSSDLASSEDPPPIPKGSQVTLIVQSVAFRNVSFLRVEVRRIGFDKFPRSDIETETIWQ